MGEKKVNHLLVVFDYSQCRVNTQMGSHQWYLQVLVLDKKLASFRRPVLFPKDLNNLAFHLRLIAPPVPLANLFFPHLVLIKLASPRSCTAKPALFTWRVENQ